MQERMAKNVIEISRTTKETDISLKLLVYGNGNAQIQSGIGFFDHMLQSLTKHSLIDLELACKGDTFIDGHHSVEDCGIVLGQGLAQGIYPRSEERRVGKECGS